MACCLERQAIYQTKLELSPMEVCYIELKSSSQQVLKIAIPKMNLQILHFAFQITDTSP